MTPTEYTELAARTNSPHFTPNALAPDIIHAILGLSTESGELMDVVKRAFFYGKPVTQEQINNIKEEMGDVLWYLSLLLRALGLSFEEVMAANIRKLATRYPNKFNPDDAYNRDLQAERRAMGDSQ